jgi:hypothetical protein
VVVTICSSYCIYLGCILLFSANNTWCSIYVCEVR